MMKPPVTQPSSEPRRRHAPRVVISNAFSDDNRGGAAITGATVAILKDALPDCRITLASVQEGSAKNLYRHTLRIHPDVVVLPPVIKPGAGALAGLRAVGRSLLILLNPGFHRGPAMEQIRHADLVVGKGGFIFVDRGGMRGVLSLWLTTFPLIIAARLGIPIIVLGATVGPFHERLSRFIAAIPLRRAALIVVRDPRSAGEVRSIRGLKGRVCLSPDVVFRHRPPANTEQRRTAERLGLGGVTFGIMTVRAGDSKPKTKDLLRRLAIVGAGLLNQGTVQHLAVVVQTDGETSSDRLESERLLRLMRDPRVSLVTADLSPRELLGLYGQSEFTLACRLHSALFSLIAGTPAFAVSLDGVKTEGVFESLGLPEYVMTPDFDPSAAIQMVKSALATGQSLRTRVAEAVTHARDDIDHLPRVLRDLAYARGIA